MLFGFELSRVGLSLIREQWWDLVYDTPHLLINTVHPFTHIWEDSKGLGMCYHNEISWTPYVSNTRLYNLQLQSFKCFGLWAAIPLLSQTFYQFKMLFYVHMVMYLDMLHIWGLGWDYELMLHWVMIQVSLNSGHAYKQYDRVFCCLDKWSSCDDSHISCVLRLRYCRHVCPTRSMVCSLGPVFGHSDRVVRFQVRARTALSTCSATFVQCAVTSLDAVFVKMNSWSESFVTKLYCYISLHILGGYTVILEPS